MAALFLDGEKMDEARYIRVSAMVDAVASVPGFQETSTHSPIMAAGGCMPAPSQVVGLVSNRFGAEYSSRITTTRLLYTRPFLG